MCVCVCTRTFLPDNKRCSAWFIQYTVDLYWLIVEVIGLPRDAFIYTQPSDTIVHLSELFQTLSTLHNFFFNAAHEKIIPIAMLERMRTGLHLTWHHR